MNFFLSNNFSLPSIINYSSDVIKGYVTLKGTDLVKGVSSPIQHMFKSDRNMSDFMYRLIQQTIPLLSVPFFIEGNDLEVSSVQSWACTQIDPKSVLKTNVTLPGRDTISS